MAVEGAGPHCDSNSLLRARNKSQKQNQGQVPPHNHNDSHNSQRIPQNCSVPSKAIKYWLVFSFCLNALFLSALLGHNAPFSFSHQVNQSIGDITMNGAGNAQSELRNQPCFGQGHYESDGVNGGGCRCYSCFTGDSCSEIIDDCTINFDLGDPKMFETFWSSNQDATTTVLLGGDRMSYFSNTDAVCWFLEPSLAAEINLLHKMVGNAVIDGHHIVVGTGSSQIIHAALYALSSSPCGKPVDVVSAAPFYSSYPPMTDLLQSGLHRWAGDALNYELDHRNAYIELVTSPGNPDGMLHTAVVNGTGPVIYDLAYYWPQYTPISFAADYDMMLFTVSKLTGHAGTRVGWALVRDIDIAKRMIKYIELSTIGVSKDSQFRASQILKAIRKSPHHTIQKLEGQDDVLKRNSLFDYGYRQMESRWQQLRAALNKSDCFTLENFPSGHCNFFGEETVPHPAFAWVRCEKDEDCHAVFKANGILTRSGINFGSSSKHVRISMVDRDKVFRLFVSRLQHIIMSCGGR